jgi:hypothetical protein
VPYPKDYFGTLSTPFQWLDLPESETLVSQSTRSTRKPENQKYQRYQKTREPEVPEVPEVPENQKHQSRNLQIKFGGVKYGFSHIQAHQATRLSQAHILVSSEFDFEHFHFLVIFLAQGKRCLQA